MSKYLIASGVEQTTETTGILDLVLIAPRPGRRAFVDAIANSNWVPYRCDDAFGNYEIGWAQVVAGTPDKLKRAGSQVVIESMLNGVFSTNACDFPAGLKTVTCDLPAEAIMWPGVAPAMAESNIASAATTDLGSLHTFRAQITGTTTITSLGAQPYTIRWVRFSGALTLTHNATSLILPGGTNITTAAGDAAMFASDAAGNWCCYSYSRASAAKRTADVMAVGPAGSELTSDGLGIGMTPINVLDLYKNTNGSVRATVKNDNTGSATSVGFSATNGTNSVQLYQLGEGWTTSGANLQAGAALVATGSGGISIVANNPSGVVRVYTGGTSETARFTVGGGLLMTGNSAPSLGGMAGQWRIQTNGSAGYNISLIATDNNYAGLTCKRINIANATDEDPAATPQFSINGNGYSALHWLDGTAYYIGQNSNSRELRMFSGSSATTGVKLTSGSTSWATTSDMTTKVRIEGIDNALQKAASIEGFIGRYNDDAEDVRRSFINGQQLRAALPEATSLDAEGMIVARLAEIIPLHSAAFAEVAGLIAAMQASIDALAQRVATLEAGS